MVSDSDLASQKEADLKVIGALRDAGSDLSKPHNIEHHFVCSSGAVADQLHSWGVERGLQATRVMSDEYQGAMYFHFDFVIPTVPTIENVFRDTSRFFTMADEFGVEYDGWQCAIVR
jgi:regulator of RNase E activity RraB